VADQNDNWIVAYDFEQDDTQIAQLQEASLGDTEFGLDPEPLVGAEEWWREIASGRRPTITVEGTIGDVYWGSMGDWPEVRIEMLSGESSTWTREGDGRRYVAGLAIRVVYVEHRWKRPDRSLGGDMAEVVLRVEIEDSPSRSAAIAPGPGGAGYELARRHGDVVHYLRFGEARAAEQAVPILEGRGLDAHAYGGRAGGGWFVEAWHGDPVAASGWRDRLAVVAIDVGGSYDGGEVVDGEVWGPVAPASSLDG
jgi:hypothetical protein